MFENERPEIRIVSLNEKSSSPVATLNASDDENGCDCDDNIPCSCDEGPKPCDGDCGTVSIPSCRSEVPCSCDEGPKPCDGDCGTVSIPNCRSEVPCSCDEGPTVSDPGDQIQQNLRKAAGWTFFKITGREKKR
jgi:hypothetical protein